MVKEKSSAGSAGVAASATPTARSNRGSSAGSPKGSFDWAPCGCGASTLRRVRYASRRCSSSPRQTEPWSTAGVPWPWSIFSAISPRARGAASFSTEENSVEKFESQKLQARKLDGSIAPHCEHVVVTGGFCAADASTPVRREYFEDTTIPSSQAQICRPMSPIGQRGSLGKPMK